MYQDYVNAIARFYGERYPRAEFPQRLINPTPAGLRDECAFVYRNRYDKRDYGTLQTFFEFREGADIGLAIDQFKPDKFKPLAKYIKGPSVSTDKKNIELLAWLLNFPERPFKPSGHYGSFPNKSIAQIVAEAQESGTRNEDLAMDVTKVTEIQPGVEPVQEGGGGLTLKSGSRRKMSVISIAVIAIVGVFSWWLWPNQPVPKDCMVWNDDHFDAVPCDSIPFGGIHVPVDERTLRSVRRIKNTDTIEQKHVGVFSYQKRGRDSIDFYTAPGIDPVNPRRDLRRLTQYIYDKYLKNKRQNAR